jgi:hypothetical protein
MLKTKSKLSDQYRTLPSRIAQLRAEAEALIDAKVAEQRREAPGVPNQSIKIMLTAPYGNDVLDAAIAIVSTEMKEGN